MPDSERTPSFLVQHIWRRSFDVSALAAPPLLAGYLKYKGTLSPETFLRAACRGVWGAGTGLGFVLAFMTVRSMPAVGVDDRVFRLLHNENQLRLDRLQNVCVIGGAVAGLLLFRRMPITPLQRAAAGGAFGFPIAMLVNVAVAEREDGPNRMVEEIKTMRRSLNA